MKLGGKLRSRSHSLRMDEQILGPRRWRPLTRHRQISHITGTGNRNMRYINPGWNLWPLSHLWELRTSNPWHSGLKSWNGCLGRAGEGRGGVRASLLMPGRGDVLVLLVGGHVTLWGMQVRCQNDCRTGSGFKQDIWGCSWTRTHVRTFQVQLVYRMPFMLFILLRCTAI